MWRAWQGRVGMNENGEDTIARLWSAEGEKPTLDEIKSMFAHLESLCVKKGRESCKKWCSLLYTSERDLMQTNVFILFFFLLEQSKQHFLSESSVWELLPSGIKALSMFTTSTPTFIASLYTSVKQRSSEWSCHQINVSLYSPFTFRNNFSF